MRFRHVALAALAVAGCHNFEELVDQCEREGRCGDAGTSGAGGGSAAPSARLTADRSSLAFSSTAGARTAEQLITFTNAADAGPAGMLSIAYAGLPSGSFVASNGCTGTIGPGEQCSFGVAFEPPANATPGDAGGSFSFASSNANTVTVPVTVQVTPSLALSPQPLEIGSVTVGRTGSADLTVRNLTLGNVTVQPVPVQPPFSVRGTACPSGISAMGTCVVTFDFAPADAGMFTQDALVTFAGGGAATLRITGNGVVPGSLSVSPDPIGAGIVDAGSTAALPFTLTSSAPVGVGPITFAVESDAGVFRVDAGACAFLDAGQSCAGLVYFSPVSWGRRSARLVVDGGVAGFAFAQLEGTGRQAVALDVQLSASGAGTVYLADGGLSCSSACSRSFEVTDAPYPVAELGAARSRLYGFTGWQGCSPTPDGGCTVEMAGPQSVTALFLKVPVAFVTSSRFPGGFGAANADTICQTHADDAGLGGSFRAWLSSGSGDAHLRIRDAGYARVDGLTFVESKRDLLAGKVKYPLALDEHGVHVGDAGRVWTGSSATGGLLGTCGATWSSGTTGSGTSGEATAGTDYWTNIGFAPCSELGRLYCFDQASGAALVPTARPPAGAVVMFISGMQFANGGTASQWPSYCAGYGADAGYPGTYVPYFATTSQSASASLPGSFNGPVYRLDGVRVLQDVAALRGSTSLDAPISVAHDGVYQQTPVATGAFRPNFMSGGMDENCYDWSGTNASFTFGSSALSRVEGWFYRGSASCMGGVRVYCVGQ